MQYGDVGLGIGNGCTNCAAGTFTATSGTAQTTGCSSCAYYLWNDFISIKFLLSNYFFPQFK